MAMVFAAICPVLNTLCAVTFILINIYKFLKSYWLRISKFVNNKIDAWVMKRFIHSQKKLINHLGIDGFKKLLIESIDKSASKIKS